jgi:cobalamin synthase
LFRAAAIVAVVGFVFGSTLKENWWRFGDVLGASEQIAESFILLYFVVFIQTIWLSWLI